MPKSKKKKTISIDREKSLSFQNSLLGWKAKDLLSLGLTLFICMHSLRKYRHFPEELSVDKHLWFSESFPIWQEHIAKKCADIGVSNREEMLSYVIETAKSNKINEMRCFERLSLSCYLLCFAYGKDIMPGNNMSKADITKFVAFERVIRDESNKALGYWICKLEEMKRGKKNVAKRTIEKESNKAKLKEFMQTMKPEEYRLKAQKDFGVTDRTVLNWLKEIQSEKTALLRKNKDTA